MMPRTISIWTKLLMVVAALAISVVPALAEDGSEQEAKRQGDPYALGVCAVSGEELGSMGDPVVKVYEGREVRFCCAGCIKTYEKEQEARNQKLDQAMVEDQQAFYPNDKCINAGSDLEGGGVTFIAGNRMFKTCCNNCKAKVEGNVEDFIERLDNEVIDAQKADYPLDTDVVTGEELAEDTVNVVVANRLIVVNTEDSAQKVLASPDKYIGKIDEARKG